MDEIKDQDYKLAVANRLKDLLSIIGLEIAGFSEFINRSPIHIYGILNTSRPLSNSLAIQIGEKLNFDGNILFRIDIKIPKKINAAKELINFRVKYKNNPEYFLNTKKNRSIDYFIQYELLESDLFNNGPKYIKEIRKYCKIHFNKDFTSDQLSKGLKYASSKGLITTKKQPLIKKDGSYGLRMVDVFYI